jgi:hypothetical protein
MDWSRDLKRLTLVGRHHYFIVRMARGAASILLATCAAAVRWTVHTAVVEIAKSRACRNGNQEEIVCQHRVEVRKAEITGGWDSQVIRRIRDL